MVLESTDGTALVLAGTCSLHSSAFCHMHTFCVWAWPTLLRAEAGARLTELEALVATEVILPEWLQQLRY